MTFQAIEGRVHFDGKPIREITRARIKTALRDMREEANSSARDKLDALWMSLIRASVEANHQMRKAA